ncbi:MAG: DegT/DnrJ/EryC1/StrS family aminotransferase [Candidatus Hydrogenedentota bacterium]|nr:MAG: DegT/DnrJ/EryC1/StrS family aminotransferase [Candidatus Hydrogenedentota bacterium]
MELRVKLAEDTIDETDLEALAEWLKTKPRLTKGPLTLEFEKEWSRWLGRRHSVFCNSGSSANLLAYYTLLLSNRLRNRRVIIPVTGWVTTIAPAIQFGLEPIPCSAAPDTFALDSDHLADLCARYEPALVVLVQVLGVPASMEPILDLKERYGFLLIEDACAAIGSHDGHRRVGTYGDLSTFSLYFGHQCSTIEGGIVSTDDLELHELLLMLRSHGWSKDVSRATHAKLVREFGIDDFNEPFVFYQPGFNLRSSDLNAFLGLRQIPKLSWIARKRDENHRRYLRRLGEVLRFQKFSDESVVSSIHTAAVARNSAERKQIVAALRNAGIETRMYTAGNLCRHPFWTDRYPPFSSPLPDLLYEAGFFLPNHPYLTGETIDEIAEIIQDSLKNPAKDTGARHDGNSH